MKEIITIKKEYIIPYSPDDEVTDISLNVNGIWGVEALYDGTTRFKYNFGTEELLIKKTIQDFLKLLNTLIYSEVEKKVESSTKVELPKAVTELKMVVDPKPVVKEAVDAVKNELVGIKPKRHRRTRAEMAAFRAQQAIEKAKRGNKKTHRKGKKDEKSTIG
jgi:hypothetical protein